MKAWWLDCCVTSCNWQCFCCLLGSDSGIHPAGNPLWQHPSCPPRVTAASISSGLCFHSHIILVTLLLCHKLQLAVLLLSFGGPRASHVTNFTRNRGRQVLGKWPGQETDWNLGGSLEVSNTGFWSCNGLQTRLNRLFLSPASKESRQQAKKEANLLNREKTRRLIRMKYCELLLGVQDQLQGDSYAFPRWRCALCEGRFISPFVNLWGSRKWPQIIPVIGTHGEWTMHVTLGTGSWIDNYVSL